MPSLLPSEEKRSSDKEKDFNPKNAALRVRKKNGFSVALPLGG